MAEHLYRIERDLDPLGRPVGRKAVVPLTEAFGRALWATVNPRFNRDGPFQRFAYMTNTWVNQKVLEAIFSLSEAERRGE